MSSHVDPGNAYHQLDQAHYHPQAYIQKSGRDNTDCRCTEPKDSREPEKVIVLTQTHLYSNGGHCFSLAIESSAVTMTYQTPAAPMA